MNEFVSISKLKNAKINLQITSYEEQTYEVCEIRIYSVKDSRKLKDIQARLLFNLCETSVGCRMVQNGRNIVVFDSSRLFLINYYI